MVCAVRISDSIPRNLWDPELRSRQASNGCRVFIEGRARLICGRESTVQGGARLAVFLQSRLSLVAKYLRRDRHNSSGSYADEGDDVRSVSRRVCHAYCLRRVLHTVALHDEPAAGGQAHESAYSRHRAPVQTSRLRHRSPSLCGIWKLPSTEDVLVSSVSRSSDSMVDDMRCP